MLNSNFYSSDKREVLLEEFGNHNGTRQSSIDSDSDCLRLFAGFNSFDSCKADDSSART